MVNKPSSSRNYLNTFDFSILTAYNSPNVNRIINIRGTYGSGKTTLARRVMEMYSNRKAHYVDGRKKPLYYTLDHPQLGRQKLAVVGSYETVCGGCDTISTPTQVFETVDQLFQEGYDVFYESLLLTGDVGRTQYYAEHEGWPLYIIMLDLPEQLCIDSVNLRREARGQMEPVNPKNLLAKIKSVRSSCATLERAGVDITRTDRDGAFAACCRLLNLDPLNVL